MSQRFDDALDENRDWRDDPANAWCKVCDRGLEGCTHSPVDPEH